MRKNRSNSADSAEATSEPPLLDWLQRRANQFRRGYIFSGLVTAIAAFCVLGLTEIVTSALIFFLSLGIRLEMSEIFAVSLAIIGLLFLINNRTPRRHPADVYLGSFEVDLLLAGPRLACAALADFSKARRLAHLNPKTCSVVLGILLQRGRKVSFLDLSRYLEMSYVEAEQIFVQLSDLEGVVKLHANPVGLSLTEDLRQELRRVLRGQIRPEYAEEAGQAEPEIPADAEPALSEEHKLLGVAARAGEAEIKAAYRLRMKQYHPDRYADRGEEWRKWSEEKTKCINAAYEVLLAKCGQPQGTPFRN